MLNNARDITNEVFAEATRKAEAFEPAVLFFLAVQEQEQEHQLGRYTAVLL